MSQSNNNGPLKRGDVYTAHFNPPDKPQKTISKYVVILQEGMIVEHSSTVVCVNMTTKHLDDVYPWDVFVDPQESCTTDGAKIICSQLHSIPKDNLRSYKYSLKPETMQEVDRGILLGTGIFKYEDITAEDKPT